MTSLAGDRHPRVKLTEDLVALARLIAADRETPRGWMRDMAKVNGVTLPALVAAVGGQTWSCIDAEVPPVAPWIRFKLEPNPTRKAPKCPRCSSRKYRRRLDCTHVFHSIDHRPKRRA